MMYHTLSRNDKRLEHKMNSLYWYGVSVTIPAFEDHLFFEVGWLGQDFCLDQLSELRDEAAHKATHTQYAAKVRNDSMIRGANAFALMSQLASELAPTFMRRSVYNEIEQVPFAAFIFHRCVVASNYSLSWAWRKLLFNRIARRHELRSLVFLAFDNTQPLYQTRSVAALAAARAAACAAHSRGRSCRRSS
jgi:hypothetical protein